MTFPRVSLRSTNCFRALVNGCPILNFRTSCPDGLSGTVNRIPTNRKCPSHQVVQLIPLEFENGIWWSMDWTKRAVSQDMVSAPHLWFLMLMLRATLRAHSHHAILLRNIAMESSQGMSRVLMPKD